MSYMCNTPFLKTPACGHQRKVNAMFDYPIQNFFVGRNHFEVFQFAFGVSLFFIVLSSLFAQLIVNHIGRFCKLLSRATEIDNHWGEKILKILHKLAVNHITDWILDKLDAYHPVYKWRNIGYGEGISLLFSLLLIILYPKGLLANEWISILVFSLLVIEKLWMITNLNALWSRIEQLETAGIQCYQENRLDEALRVYRQALTSLSQAWVSSNTVLDRKRVELLEQIATILDHQRQFREAMIYYNRLLALLNRPHLARD